MVTITGISLGRKACGCPVLLPDPDHWVISSLGEIQQQVAGGPLFFYPFTKLLNLSHHSPARTGSAGRLANSPRNGLLPQNHRIIPADVVDECRARLSAAAQHPAGVHGQVEKVTSWIARQGYGFAAARRLVYLLTPLV